MPKKAAPKKMPVKGMPPKGMHGMPDGHMMKDADKEMEKRYPRMPRPTPKRKR